MCDFCKPSCLLESYTRTISLSELWIAPEDRDDRVKYVQFHVNFVDFRSRRYRQFPAMTPQSVISGIGGVMGVFIGASLITCIEMVLFLVKLLCKKCTNGNAQVVPDSDDNRQIELDAVPKSAIPLPDGNSRKYRRTSITGSSNKRQGNSCASE